ncbi:MAG TPA: dimethylarginine dimethylaminohydrolase [Afifellaceae bacterium]|nr:dimethylarginine dimethylaminohydrolase [Afifellaceae bacterium]
MRGTELPYCFSHALVRTPAESAARGLRAVDAGDPDIGLFRAEHEHYCRALTEAGMEVIRLEPLDRFPDSVFVEDPALVLPEAVILLRSAAQSRAGEGEHIAPALQPYRPLFQLPEGYVDGGDILVTGREVIVGLSDRTDHAGFLVLRTLLGRWQYATRCVELPDGLLHLKTGCSLLDGETILAVGALASAGLFDGYDIIELPPDEEAAANAIRVNDHLLISEGHGRTAQILSQHGYRVVEIPTAQAALLDGGLSCMSLRF